MSDWGAVHSLSIEAGLDQEMPGNKVLYLDFLLVITMYIPLKGMSFSDRN